MKLTVLQPVEIDAAFIRVRLPVRHDDQQIPADFPLRRGDWWEATVAVDNGQVMNWPKGRTGDLHLKVVDEGEYTLLNHCGEPIAERVNDYVPDCIPQKWGDYVCFDIDANGVVALWQHHCTPEKVRRAFFPRPDLD